MEQPPSKYSNQRAPGKEHIPLYPKGFVAVRIIQLILSIVCLGLCAFGIAYLVFAGDALMLFTAIATIITSIYCLVANFGPPKAFNYWAILGLDIFLVIFWLISFALLAAQVAAAFVYYDDYSDYYDDYYDLSSYDTAIKTYIGCLAGAAGLGGVEFLLYVISLSVHGVMLHRHRKAGLRAMPSNVASGGVPGAAVVPTDGEKFQMQPQANQVYPQQTVPAAGHLPPQQVIYPQNSPSPLSAQPTGNSYVQPQQIVNPGQPIYEVPGQPQQYHPA
ncbi:uncharacterized protein F4807DRAFT_275267 [Annulohypoxylon truncatum]|uniref:uncharacterized protein n=1 Tax=Annulohypoxylon truncatum TaxID=327061 RepID=UPI0020075681|nr:uncharacterized protein F4807DRAFT_275267 [Annulohypoxylon truncatum]KAI1205578.1 hypothetical protein F4807DRAFT_275267 [Annulohypoxylon truncatum]